MDSSGDQTPTEGTTSIIHAPKKTRSDVWEHFQKLYDSESKETGRAMCVLQTRLYGKK